MARFSITAMAADSSGWAKASACDHRMLDPAALARSAAQKAPHSAHPRELPPGRYTVVLEPAAVLDLVGQMFADFSATAIRDGRSFLNDRIGNKLFGENITIRRRRASPAPIRRGVRWRRRAAPAADAGRETAWSAEIAVLPAGRGHAGRRAHRARLPGPQRDRREPR